MGQHTRNGANRESRRSRLVELHGAHLFTFAPHQDYRVGYHRPSARNGPACDLRAAHRVVRATPRSRVFRRRSRCAHRARSRLHRSRVPRLGRRHRCRRIRDATRRCSSTAAIRMFRGSHIARSSSVCCAHRRALRTTLRIGEVSGCQSSGGTTRIRSRTLGPIRIACRARSRIHGRKSHHRRHAFRARTTSWRIADRRLYEPENRPAPGRQRKDG